MAPDSGLGPGQYEEKRQFGSGVKPVTIKLRKKKHRRSEIKVGPGSYMPENADALTRIRSSFASFSKTLARPSEEITNLKLGPGPGDYEENRFSSTDKKPFTIG